jgi:transcriptional regulator with XRE-family HTH domain
MLNTQTELLKIGNKIKKLRIKKGYKSHETFAYENGFSRVHYWRIENGKTNVTLKSIVDILNIHKISLKEFFSKEFD